MLKRTIDLLLSLIALLFLAPVLLVTMLLVRIIHGTPIFFKQARPGLNENIFHLYKFRTMTSAVGGNGKFLPDSERITKFGTFLRKTSLDELPSLINIIKGDMSIVGPRPLLPEYLPFYSQSEKIRHTVRPGLTGLAQVSGRNHLSWDDRLAADIDYVKNWSLMLDFRIIIKTAFKVLKREDVLVVPSTKFGKLNEERSKKGKKIDS